jgi:hypothetical protein
MAYPTSLFLAWYLNQTSPHPHWLHALLSPISITTILSFTCQAAIAFSCYYFFNTVTSTLVKFNKLYHHREDSEIILQEVLSVLTDTDDNITYTGKIPPVALLTAGLLYKQDAAIESALPSTNDSTHTPLYSEDRLPKQVQHLFHTFVNETKPPFYSSTRKNSTTRTSLLDYLNKLNNKVATTPLKHWEKEVNPLADSFFYDAGMHIGVCTGRRGMADFMDFDKATTLLNPLMDRIYNALPTTDGEEIDKYVIQPAILLREFTGLMVLIARDIALDKEAICNLYTDVNDCVIQICKCAATASQVRIMHELLCTKQALCRIHMGSHWIAVLASRTNKHRLSKKQQKIRVICPENWYTQHLKQQLLAPYARYNQEILTTLLKQESDHPRGVYAYAFNTILRDIATHGATKAIRAKALQSTR